MSKEDRVTGLHGNKGLGGTAVSLSCRQVVYPPTPPLISQEQVLEGLVEEARSEIRRLGGNPILSKILDALVAVHTQP